MKGSYREKLLRVFPPPSFLTMPSVGIDVSDHSVKIIEFHLTKKGLEVGRFAEHSIPDNIVVSGKIEKPDALKDILAEVRKEHKLHFVRATLPEESGYLFELSLPRLQEDEMETAIEFRLEENVPLSPTEAVFGYDVVKYNAGPSNKRKKRKERDVVVSVFPNTVAEMYAQLFHDAGLVPLALETEPQATARSVVPHNDFKTHLIVDFGRERSGISIVSGGAVRFATTTNAGGDAISKAFKKNYKESTKKQITQMKNTQGLHLVRESTNPVFKSEIISVVEKLNNEIKKHVQYWNTRTSVQKNNTHVSKIVLCGGNANFAGLPEYLSQNLKLPVERANVWTNAFSLERYIPSFLSFSESLGYAPAIGLALGGVPRITPR